MESSKKKKPYRFNKPKPKPATEKAINKKKKRDVVQKPLSEPKNENEGSDEENSGLPENMKVGKYIISTEKNPKEKKTKRRRRSKDEHDDEEEEEEPEMKIERFKRKVRFGFKISSSDVTSKRYVDSRTLRKEKLRPVNNKAEGETLPETEQASVNAQFRAIKPKESILSYINSNVIGRRRIKEWKQLGYSTNHSAPLDDIPFSEAEERAKIEENIFRNKLKLLASAKSVSSFPPDGLPEIAFAGRSNVGKSSLLNSLTRQWGVAKTSDKPGLTQTINFYGLGSKLCVVDLPGYGFAYAKEEVKESWQELVKEYVVTRDSLKRVCLLVDSKWGLKSTDYELIDLMESCKRRYMVVMTKTDLVFPMDVARRATQIEETLKPTRSMVKPLLMVSAKTGGGIRCLRSSLAMLSRYVKI